MVWLYAGYAAPPRTLNAPCVFAVNVMQLGTAAGNVKGEIGKGEDIKVYVRGFVSYGRRKKWGFYLL